MRVSDDSLSYKLVSLTYQRSVFMPRQMGRCQYFGRVIRGSLVALLYLGFGKVILPAGAFWFGYTVHTKKVIDEMLWDKFSEGEDFTKIPWLPTVGGYQTKPIYLILAYCFWHAAILVVNWCTLERVFTVVVVGLATLLVYEVCEGIVFPFLESGAWKATKGYVGDVWHRRVCPDVEFVRPHRTQSE